MGDAVAGSLGSGSGSGSACATCSGSIDPVKCTATVLVSDPPQTFVAVSLKVLVSSRGPVVVWLGSTCTDFVPLVPVTGPIGSSVIESALVALHLRSAVPCSCT